MKYLLILKVLECRLYNAIKLIYFMLKFSVIIFPNKLQVSSSDRTKILLLQIQNFTKINAFNMDVLLFLIKQKI